MRVVDCLVALAISVAVVLVGAAVMAAGSLALAGAVGVMP